MKKAAVIYKTKYGSTKKYAWWIAEELGADLLDAGKITASALQNYDVIVYGGGLYAGCVNGISLITKNFDSIKNKAIYLFTVGVADVSDKQNVDHIRDTLFGVLTPEMQKSIEIFHLRGGIDYSSMSLVHRAMMGMMVKMLRKKPESELSRDDKEMIASHGQKVDYTDRSAILPLVDAIKSSMM